MRIGAVADEAEVSPRMVRHYANQGLLTPGRDINGYRSFEQGDVAPVRQIQALIRLGMTVEEIRRVQGCLDASSPVPTCPATVNALREQLHEVDAQIANLAEHRRRLHQTLREIDPDNGATTPPHETPKLTDEPPRLRIVLRPVQDERSPDG